MAKFTRKGLHRLECPMCPGYAYGTVANLELVGLPSCPCGERLQPTELELAFILGADESRPMREYVAKRNSVAKGQAGPGGALLAETDHYESPDDQAAALVDERRRALARARQLEALGFMERKPKDGKGSRSKPTIIRIPVAEPMAF